AHLGAAGLLQSASVLRVAPFLSYRVAPPPVLAVAMYYVAVAGWWTLWRRRVESVGSAEGLRARAFRRGAVALAAISALWILVDPRTLVGALGDGHLHATVIDVGQGDAIFVVFPRGSTLLVDAGGLSPGSSFDVGDRVVAPVIRDAGFRRLDRVALTHGDPDHIGGAAAILTRVPARGGWGGLPGPRAPPLPPPRALAPDRGRR